MTNTPRKAIRQALASNAKAALEAKNCRTALAHFPRMIQVNQLPLVIVSGKEATYNTTLYGEEQFTETRLFDLLVHVSQGLLGTDGQAETEVEEYIDLLQDYFGARQILDVVVDEASEDIFAIDILPVGDSYIQQFEYMDPTAPGKMGQSFLGTTFTIQVTYEKTIEHVN